MTKLDEILMSDEIYAQAWADDVPESVITSVISGLSAVMEDALLYEVRISIPHASTNSHAGTYGWFYRDVAEHPGHFTDGVASGRIVLELDTAWTEAHELEAAPYRASIGFDADGRSDQSCVVDRRTGHRVSQWFAGRTTVTDYGIALTWNTGNHLRAIEQRFVVRTSPDFQTARVIDTVLVQVAEQFEGLNAYHRATWLARAKNNVADQANTPVVWDARAHI